MYILLITYMLMSGPAVAMQEFDSLSACQTGGKAFNVLTRTKDNWVCVPKG